MGHLLSGDCPHRKVWDRLRLPASKSLGGFRRYPGGSGVVLCAASLPSGGGRGTTLPRPSSSSLSFLVWQFSETCTHTLAYPYGTGAYSGGIHRVPRARVIQDLLA